MASSEVQRENSNANFQLSAMNDILSTIIGSFELNQQRSWNVPLG